MFEHFRKHGVVHLVWAIAILLATLIGVLSYRLGPDDEISSLLNFALALSSLVLAIIAIVQALIGSAQFSETVGKVRSAVDSIMQPAAKLDAAAEVIGRYSENIGQHAWAIHEQTNQLLARTSIVPSEATDQGRFDKASLAPTLSPGAGFSLYLCLRSFETARPIPGNFWTEPSTQSFVFGYINALANLSLIAAVAGDGGGIQVLDLGPLHWLPEIRVQLRGLVGMFSNELPANQVIMEVDALFEDASPSQPGKGGAV